MNIVITCKLCSSRVKDLENVEVDSAVINRSMILGSQSTGSGCSSTTDFLAHLDVPTMTPKTWLNHELELSDQVVDLAEKEMRVAREQERNLAIEKGSVDTTDTINKGAAITAARVDCGWSKDSYVYIPKNIIFIAFLITLQAYQPACPG